MSIDPQAEAALALHRFGFGPRAGTIAAIAADPRGALLAELDRPGAGRIDNAALKPSGENTRAAFDFRQERQVKLLAEKAEKAAAGKANPDDGMEPKEGMAAEPPKPDPRAPQQIFLAEARARLEAALDAEIGFVERLVWFWSNHFCVSAGEVMSTAGSYEREAIRPHVLGRFVDMLQAVESHPAMLNYLSNAASTGPNSISGRLQQRGLNENLARETLELHTLGVRTVYTQEDVTSLARIITGWTVIPPGPDPEHGGEFVFNRRMHEPGPQTVIGTSYPDTGIEQGRAVLNDLARHPATAAHVAEKFVRHFVADRPPLPLVERLAARFRDTGGDLKEMARALVAAPEAWAEPRAKLKRPAEWVVAALRATGVPMPEIGRVARGLTLLGQPIWRPAAPAGFSDDSAAWLDGLAQRLEVANEFAARLGDKVDPAAVTEIALGPLAGAETRQAMARAESRPQALTLLLMAPEFQRR
jgi:uncharacterized protein (DUF1800 family)